MKLKLILLSLFAASSVLAVQTKCPLMINDEIDTEESVVVEGKEIGFCCGTCVRKFEENKAYYIKAIEYLNKLFTPEQRKKLGVDDVVLLQQRYCPIYPDRIVNPNCPSVEYKGMKIYFWSSSAVRRWNRDPERYYQDAVKSGVLK